MSFSYVGDSPLSRQTGERYFYAMRRDDDGQLFISKIDVASPTDNIQVNKPGGTSDNFPDFQDGADFFEGRNLLIVEQPSKKNKVNKKIMISLLFFIIIPII